MKTRALESVHTYSIAISGSNASWDVGTVLRKHTNQFHFENLKNLKDEDTDLSSLVKGRVSDLDPHSIVVWIRIRIRITNPDSIPDPEDVEIEKKKKRSQNT
jgi:hypothetical protein